VLDFETSRDDQWNWYKNALDGALTKSYALCSLEL